MKTAVVIPCYNHERYIGPAIESVLSQTRPPDRFLIIDDGSADGSVEIIRGFEKDGVECITQENAGAHVTLNRAIEQVSQDCELAAILNSDDIYEPARFESLLPHLESGEHAVVCSGLSLIDQDGQPLPEEESRAHWFRAVWSLEGDDNLEVWERLGVANYLATTSNVVARTDWLRKKPFRGYRFNHDYYFLVDAALRNQLTVVPESLLRYRVHPSNTINSAPAPLLKEMLQMHLDLYKELGPELRRDDSLRQRFHEYSRSSWNSVSSFHAGLLQAILAEALADQSPESLQSLIESLDVEELNHYPNAALVHQFDGSAPLLREGGAMSDKVGILKRERSEAKADNTTLKELLRLRAQLQTSRWVSLGRVFGCGKRLSANTGQNPADKLANLRTAMEESSWLKLGQRLGCWTPPQSGR